MKFTETIRVEAPIERVFEMFTNLSQSMKVLTGVTAYELVEGPVQMAVGTRWRETRTMMGKDSTEEMWVSALEKNVSYVVDADSHGTKYQSTFQFKTVDGGTEVSWEFEGVPYKLFSKIMSIVSIPFAGGLKKLMTQDMEELKAACE
jgi:carbon monoxide dehydrogenase subunit G